MAREIPIHVPGMATRQGIMASAYLADDAIEHVRLMELRDRWTLVLHIVLRAGASRHPFDVDLVLERARSAAYFAAPCGYHVITLLDVGEEPLRACRRCHAPLADDVGDVPNAGACEPCAELVHERNYIRTEIAAFFADMPAAPPMDPFLPLGSLIAERNGLRYSGSRTAEDGIVRLTFQQPARTMIVLDAVIGTDNHAVDEGGTQ